MSDIPRVGPLFTDLYELTMAAGYLDQRQHQKRATFSLFIRNHPPNRGYLVAAGLEDVLSELESLVFSRDDLEYLRHTGLFSESFLDYLQKFSFTGDVRAMPEGSLVFANEPILEVTAPLIEAQIVETLLLNTVGVQTLIASKAARCVSAAQGRSLIDFSMRRTQGRDAGLKVARCSYLVGFTATSNCLAGKIYDIPVSGTMAHSYVTTFASEIDAFRAFAESFPHNAVFLIDTYDTLAGARNAATVGREMQQKGHRLIGVRLDSGDMVDLSRKVRSILDAAGLTEVKIFASGGFDEYKIHDALTKGAKIDAFGVGTKMGVSADAPYLDIVYKMVRFDGLDVRKLSPGKMTLAGEKQLFRLKGADGQMTQDFIGHKDEQLTAAAPLLQSMMVKGARCEPEATLAFIRDQFKLQFAGLGDGYKRISDPDVYPVAVTPLLAEIQRTLPS